jgi:hypothetical protein
VDTGRVVLAGIGVWAVALVVLLLLGDRVADMWIWTCVAAIGLALMGLGVMRLQGQLPGRRAAHGGTAEDDGRSTADDGTARPEDRPTGTRTADR